jgi:hypothetical protein
VTNVRANLRIGLVFILLAPTFTKQQQNLLVISGIMFSIQHPSVYLHPITQAQIFTITSLDCTLLSNNYFGHHGAVLKPTRTMSIPFSNFIQGFLGHFQLANAAINTL